VDLLNIIAFYSQASCLRLCSQDEKLPEAFRLQPLSSLNPFSTPTMLKSSRMFKLFNLLSLTELKTGTPGPRYPCTMARNRHLPKPSPPNLQKRMFRQHAPDRQRRSLPRAFKGQPSQPLRRDYCARRMGKSWREDDHASDGNIYSDGK
jgi:hypothetical protein